MLIEEKVVANGLVLNGEELYADYAEDQASSPGGQFGERRETRRTDSDRDRARPSREARSDRPERSERPERSDRNEGDRSTAGSVSVSLVGIDANTTEAQLMTLIKVTKQRKKRVFFCCVCSQRSPLRKQPARFPSRQREEKENDTRVC